MKYFFHLEDGACIHDAQGEEFPNDAAAMLEATNVAHELSKLRVHAMNGAWWSRTQTAFVSVRCLYNQVSPNTPKAFLFRLRQFIKRTGYANGPTHGFSQRTSYGANATNQLHHCGLSGNDDVRFLPARYAFEGPALHTPFGTFATDQMGVLTAAGTVDWRTVNKRNKR
jgi:hypothetical protein